MTPRNRTAGRIAEANNAKDIIWSVPPIVVLVWCLGIAAKIWAACRIIRRGLFDPLALFLAFIFVSVARSLALLCLAQNPRWYRYVAADSLPMVLLSEGFAIASIYWLLTENFPRWRGTGTGILSGLCVIAAGVALLLRGTATPPEWGYGWGEAWEWAVLIQRHGMTAMAVVLIGVRFLVALVRAFPVRPIARRAADVLCLDVALGLVGSQLTIWRGHQYPLIAFAWPLFSGLANGLLWAVWLPAAHIEATPAAYVPDWARTAQKIDWSQCFSDLRFRIRREADPIRDRRP
jgi:hypothetical protein